MKNIKQQRLGEAELDIMLALWSGGGPLTSVEIRERMRGKRDWALSSLMTALDRLCGKGFVACDRSTRTNLYTPLVAEDDYRARESATLLERLYGNSLGSLVASLYAGKVIGPRELEELRALLDELEGGTGR